MSSDIVGDKPKGKTAITVIGSGNGGLAFSGWFGLRGFNVTLTDFHEFTHSLKPVMESKGIEVKGVMEGFAPVTVVDNIPEAIRDADIVMAVMPAIAHARLAKEIGPHLKQDTLLILNPGRTGGALEVYRLFSRAGRKAAVLEAQTLLFSCRKTASSTVFIYGIKKKLPVAVMPSLETPAAMEAIKEALPQFYAVEDVRTTSLWNIGAMFHPSLTITNVSRIDAQIPFELYHDGATKNVGRLIQGLDDERVSLSRAMGVDMPSAREWLNQSYGVPMAPLSEMMSQNPAYQGVAGPNILETRYLDEDVPTGLVPLEAFAQLHNIEVPITSALINISNVLMGKDYRKTGRNLECLGLKGLSPRETISYLNKG